MSDRIPAAELKSWIKRIPEWDLEEKSILRTVEFDTFMEGIDFVNNVAEIAEDAQHHPDIIIHGYKHVQIMLTTHDKGKVTQKDFDLAKKIDTLK